jgi:hypothetical protein
VFGKQMTTPAPIQKLIGKSPWKVWKGFGSFLTFEFGRKRKDADGQSRGEFCLWIYMAGWQLKKGKKQIAHSESPDGVIIECVALLVGRRLDAVSLSTIVDKSGDHYSARFWFEGGFSLQAFMCDRREPSSIFMLFTPDSVLSYDNDGKIREKKGKPKRHTQQPPHLAFKRL